MKESSGRLKVDQIYYLIVLRLGSKRADEAFRIVEHVEATFTTSVLLKDRNVSNLGAYCIAVHSNAQVLKYLLVSYGLYVLKATTE